MGLENGAEYRYVDGIAVVGGNAPTREKLVPWLGKEPVVVAADSGLDTAHTLGLDPALIVGDMDSISDRALLDRYPRDRVREAAPDKDETDTELALQALAELGARRTMIVGGGGGRLDHVLAILAIFERTPHPVAWLTDRDEVVAVEEQLSVYAADGATISFFPIGNAPCRMSSTGLKWPLDELSWRRGDHGLSNKIVEDTATVRMKRGRLLMVRPMES
jgi:thiamine pyrophosphokinase